MTRAIDELCDALGAVGITCVFGIPGTQNVQLFEGFRRNRIRTVLASHELAAAFMANGYYRATGRVAALATIPGPGFTYTLTGLAEARLDSVPILYLVGKPASKPGNAFQLQAIDQRAIAEPLVKDCFRLDATCDVAALVARAHASAVAGEPGPVMVELDMESLVSGGPVPVKSTNAKASASELPIQLNGLKELFGQAQRPVLLLGQGALNSSERLRRLVERVGIPVITTPTARGILPEDHQFAMGFDPLRHRVAEVNQLLDRADLIVGLGCKLGHNGSAGFQLRLPADRFVHIDADRKVLEANYPARLAITGRVEDVMTELEARSAATQWTATEVTAARAALAPREDPASEPRIHGRTILSPREFFSWLRATLPRDAIVVTDSGLHQILTRRYFDVLAPRGLICPSDFQSMGFGLPAAIGAKIGLPDRPVVAVIGDGGFLMSGMEAMTARREDAPLMIFVFNDGQLNQIRLQQWSEFGRSHAVELLNPDFRTLASAFGIDYLRFDEADPSAIAQALAGPTPVLVEVIVGDSMAMRRVPAIRRSKELVRSALAPTLIGWLRRTFRQRQSL